jgi:hypothetical protein
MKAQKYLDWKKAVAKLLDAVKTWQLYTLAAKTANKRNDPRIKSVFMKAMFKWRKMAEQFKADERELYAELKAA